MLVAVALLVPDHFFLGEALDKQGSDLLFLTTGGGSKPVAAGV